MARPALERISLEEVVAAGKAAQKKLSLELSLEKMRGAGVVQLQTSEGQYLHHLSADETIAVIGLLIERQDIFLSSIGVDL